MDGFGKLSGWIARWVWLGPAICVVVAVAVTLWTRADPAADPG